MSRPRRLTLTTITLLALAAGCGGDATSPPPVASVTLEVVTNNPRVGETAHVGATPVDKNGRTLNVPCTFVSSTPAVANVDATGTVAALTPGVAVITVTCGGVIATTTITVRPKLVTLTITKLGAPGSVFANPIGPTYDAGTTVTVTATPLSGSVFTGWGGACAGAGVALQCQLTLTADAAVTGTFALVENFSGNVSTNSVAVTSVIGCRYSVNVTGSPAGVTCTSSPFNVNATGAISGTDSRLSANVTNGGNFNWPITATRSGSTITGSGTISEILKDSDGNSYPVSFTANFTTTKQ